MFCHFIIVGLVFDVHIQKMGRAGRSEYMHSVDIFAFILQASLATIPFRNSTSSTSTGDFRSVGQVLHKIIYDIYDPLLYHQKSNGYPRLWLVRGFPDHALKQFAVFSRSLQVHAMPPPRGPGLFEVL